MFLRQLNFVYFCFDSYFTFIAKEKLNFSLICTFNCCLVNEPLGMSSESCLASCHAGVVAYKLAAYK